MRTTVDIPEDLHRQAMAIARDTDRTFSETVADMMRRALGGEGKPTSMRRSERTGLIVVDLGKVITSEDVEALEDDE